MNREIYETLKYGEAHYVLRPVQILLEYNEGKQFTLMFYMSPDGVAGAVYVPQCHFTALLETKLVARNADQQQIDAWLGWNQVCTIYLHGNLLTDVVFSYDMPQLALRLTECPERLKIRKSLQRCVLAGDLPEPLSDRAVLGHSINLWLPDCQLYATQQFTALIPGRDHKLVVGESGASVNVYDSHVPLVAQEDAAGRVTWVWDDKQVVRTWQTADGADLVEVLVPLKRLFNLDKSPW